MTSIVGSTIFSSRSAALGLDARTAALMDSIYAIGFGLGLRFVVDLVSQHSLKTTGVLVGLWEGIVLLHFLQKMPRSFDPYVGFGVRMFADFLVTESIARMLVVLLWTGLGMVLADIAPSVWRDTGMKRAWSLFRRDLFVLLQSVPQVDVPIPFLYKQRTVRFSPSRTSSVVSAATSASTPTTAATPTVASTSAQTRAPTEQPSTSLAARAATPAPPPVVTRTPAPPQTPGTALRKRLPGHFARDSETETDLNSTVGRPRIPSTETESESGLTTDNEALGTSRGSRYSLFVPRETDLRLTESDTDDTSSTTTETPDAGTLRDISEAEVTTPTLPPTFLPLPQESVQIPIIDETAPKTPLPPPDQVPDIPDDTLDNGLDESWEKIEKEDSKSAEDKPAEDKPDEDDTDSLLIPPPVPQKWAEPVVSADKSRAMPEPATKTDKVEKAMSEPPWAEDFAVKKKGKAKGKSKSVLSSASAVDSFFKPGESGEAKAADANAGPSNTEGPPAPASTPAATSQPASPPAGSSDDTPTPTPTAAQTEAEKLIDLDTNPTPDTVNDAADTRTPPPTFSQIYPEGVPLPPSVAPTAPASTIAVDADANADASVSPTAAGTPAEAEATAAGEDDSNNKPTTSTTDSAPPPDSETESDVNTKDLPSSKRLSDALALLERIKALDHDLTEIKRQQESAELDGEDGKQLVEKKKKEAEEVEQKKAKLERKIHRRYFASYDKETDTTSLDVSNLTVKPATEAVEERILHLLASDATELEVTIATTTAKAKLSKARSLKTGLVKALKERNITAEEDFIPRLVRVKLPARPNVSSPSS